MLGFISKTVEKLFAEGGSATFTVTQRTGNLAEKMAQFIAAHQGKVYQSASPDHVLCHGIDRPVSRYARIEYASHDTTFFWFGDAESAKSHVEKLSANRHPNVKAIVGPFKIPSGRGEQFQ